MLVELWPVWLVRSTFLSYWKPWDKFYCFPSTCSVSSSLEKLKCAIFWFVAICLLSAQHLDSSCKEMITAKFVQFFLQDLISTYLLCMQCVCSNVCGGRVRVEFSTGKSKQKPWQRRAAPSSLSSRRAFDPDDRCYECGQRGHYAYDCRDRQRR